MKQIKKKPAILLIIMLSIVLVVGTIFSFVPMTFGHTSYKSFAGAIKLGNDFGEVMYAEYDISKEGSTEQVDIQRAINTIKSTLSEKGYPSTSVYSINDEKIRVELSYSTGGDNFKETYTLLKAVGVGKFELRSSSDEKDTYVIGSKHIKGVKVATYNAYTQVTLEFNEDGELAFNELLNAAGDSGSIYVCMGGQTQTSMSAKNVTSGKSLPLSFTNYNSAVDFAMKVQLGTIPVDLNANTVSINTIVVHSSILPLIIALGVIALLSLVYFAIKFGIMGVMNLVSTLTASIIATILFFGISLIEFNTSAFVALAFGFAVSVMFKNIYMSRVKSEYGQGKTIEACLESGYKKSIAPVVATAVAILIPSVVLAFVTSGILQTVSLIVIIMTVLGVFESILYLPWLIQIVEAFNKGNDKIYHFKREEV